MEESPSRWVCTPSLHVTLQVLGNQREAQQSFAKLLTFYLRRGRIEHAQSAGVNLPCTRAACNNGCSECWCRPPCVGVCGWQATATLSAAATPARLAAVDA